MGTPIRNRLDVFHPVTASRSRCSLDNVVDTINDDAGVQFRGKVLIRDKDWLSETGKHWLQNDLRRSRSANGITLDRAIAESILVVLVQGKLLSEPQYLKELPSGYDGLVVYSVSTVDGVTHRKRYHVETLEVLSYSMSRVFFSRYRTLRALEDMVKAEERLPRSEQTPQEGRKEKWLVDGYRDLVVSHHHEQARRSGTTFLPRMVHRSEVKNVFGRHAAWLKSHITRKKFLNTAFWDTILLESQARLNGEHIEDGHESEHSGPSRRRESSRELSEVDQLQEDDTPSTAALEVEYYAHTYTFTEQQNAHPPKKSALRQNAIDLLDVPLEPFQKPILSARMDWKCPFDTCQYYADFLNPSGPFLDDLSVNDRKFLLNKGWNSDDDEFLELFEDIVEHHYFMHLESMRVKVLGFRTALEDVNGEPVLKERIISGPGQFLFPNEEGIKLFADCTRKRSYLSNAKAVQLK